MKYRNDKNGEPISTLGYGCMRFTRKGTSIDYEKASKELLRSIELGVNYFDSAYIYPGSEELLGRFMEEYGTRDKMKIATKLPHYLMRSISSVNKTFDEQLKRLRTDHIDYYLMHMITDLNEWETLKVLGIEDWIRGHKADGSIRNIGFSYHGGPDMFTKVLDAYDWDFVQIQYNYIDVNSQAGRIGLNAAYERGIPVIIMEPLRGGKLTNLNKDALTCLDKYNNETCSGFTPAELALRWLWNQPGVTCVLSGMNSIEMIEENAKTASNVSANSFGDKEFELVEHVSMALKAREKVGCTGCRYCMPCPKGVDIPGNFYYYNTMYQDSKYTGRREFFQNMCLRAEPGFASQCIGCGKCEAHCPQHINIIKELKNADKALRPVYLKPVMNMAGKFYTRRRNR